MALRRVGTKGVNAKEPRRLTERHVLASVVHATKKKVDEWLQFAAGPSIDNLRGFDFISSDAWLHHMRWQKGDSMVKWR